ncbi:ABC transporter substrate-binding protein, partial [Rhizobium ruizarguesonis]
ALGGKIKALGNGVDGIDFCGQGGDWMVSALLFGAGGKMLSDDESKVAVNGPEGQKAVEVLQRRGTEGGMPVFTKAAG